MSGGLFGSTALEVAIGLVFIYFLLSIICSSVNETLAGILKWRGKSLRHGIENLLCDPDLARGVLNNQLIKAMGSTDSEGGIVRWFSTLLGSTEVTGLPSYIPSRTFALALFDHLAQIATIQTPDQPVFVPKLDPINMEQVRAGALRLANGETDASRSAGRAIIALIDSSQDPRRVRTNLEDLKKIVQNLPVKEGASPDKEAIAAQLRSVGTLEDVRRIATQVPDGEARQAVLRLIDAQPADMDAALRAVEAWFDQAMLRVSGVYKRNVQMSLLAISALASTLIGVDTINLVDRFINDPALRAALVAEAGRSAEVSAVVPSPSPTSRPPTRTPPPSTQTARNVSPTPRVTPPPQPSPSPTTPPRSDAAIDQLTRLKIPLGYSHLQAYDGGWDWWRALLRTILGLLVTTFAVSLGAPFWFDVLQRVANIRSAGRPPESVGKTSEKGK